MRFPYDAVVFDLDGTLFEAEEGIVSSVKKAMADLGLPIPAQVDLRQVIGPPLYEFFLNPLQVPEERAGKAMELYRDDFFHRGRFLYSVYPGIRLLLRSLRAAGVYVALATSKPLGLAQTILTDFYMDGYFDRIVGETADHRVKMGKPELIRQALPATYGRAAMVGDRRFDMEGASKAGIDGIGVLYGYGTRDELEKAGATAIVETTEDLWRLLCPDCQKPCGFFLTVEGPDGSGKTTQVNRLEKSLLQYGFDVQRTREPGGCSISEKIRQIILDPANEEMCDTCEALLYAAARAQHVHQVIRPAVEKGKLLLSDRFVDSSVAYQGSGRGLGIATVQQINAPAVDHMLPDATLYLSIDARQALARRLAVSEPDRLESQAVSFHQRVQQGYEQLIAQNPERFLVVDASKDADTVAREALRAVLDRVVTYEGGRIPWKESL